MKFDCLKCKKINFVSDFAICKKLRTKTDFDLVIVEGSKYLITIVEKNQDKDVNMLLGNNLILSPISTQTKLSNKNRFQWPNIINLGQSVCAGLSLKSNGSLVTSASHLTQKLILMQKRQQKEAPVQITYQRH